MTILEKQKNYADRPERACVKCGVIFSGHLCKKCRSIRKKEYIAKNRERINEQNRIWRKNNPDKQSAAVARWCENNPVKVKEYRQRSANNRKEIRKAEAKKWRELNPTKVKENWVSWRIANSVRLSEYRKTYAKENPHIVQSRKHSRRIIEKGLTKKIDPLYVKKLVECQKCSCVYCNEHLTKYQIDHKTPISRGGDNSNNNLQLLCPTCNRRKGAKTHEEYLRYLNALV